MTNPFLDLSVLERRGEYSEQFALTDDTPHALAQGKPFKPDMAKIMFCCGTDGWRVLMLLLGGKAILANGAVGKKRMQRMFNDPLDPEHVEEDLAPEWAREIVAERLALLRSDLTASEREGLQRLQELMRKGQHWDDRWLSSEALLPQDDIRQCFGWKPEPPAGARPFCTCGHTLKRHPEGGRCDYCRYTGGPCTGYTPKED